MTLRLALAERSKEICGAKLAPVQRQQLESTFQKLIPNCLLDLMTEFGLAGKTFRISAEEDESEIGVDLKWLGAEDIIKEALDFYPGKSVYSLGYIPVGSCLDGSGDPYFLFVRDIDDSCDPPLVRVPHDYATAESYPEDKVEIVSAKLSDFIRACEIA